MGYFTAEQAAELARTGVRAATLVEFQFESSTVRLWNGFGKLYSAGEIWEGLSGLGSIEGMRQAGQLESTQGAFVVSGVDAEFVRLTIEDSDEVAGRHAIVYVQIFTGDWLTFGNPIPLSVWIMDKPTLSRSAMSDTAGAVRTVRIPAENIWFSRSRPSFWRYSDRDQQSRSPGDLGCSLTSNSASKILRWPQYG